MKFWLVGDFFIFYYKIFLPFFEKDFTTYIYLYQCLFIIIIIKNINNK
jgi:uncharacterized membrane protein